MSSNLVSEHKLDIASIGHGLLVENKIFLNETQCNITLLLNIINEVTGT